MDKKIEIWLKSILPIILLISFGLSASAWIASAAEEPSNGIHTTTSAGSDDFNTCALDSMWTFVDPAADSSYTLTGAFTNDAWLQIDVPEGEEGYNLSPGTNTNAPRVMQSIDLDPYQNTDFEVEVKFESTVSARFQGQGILVEEEPNTKFMRFEFYSDGTNIHLLAARVTTGYFAHHDVVIASAGTAGPLYMRVVRVGNQWTHSYSLNGTDWTTQPSFTQEITVNSIGLHALTAVATENAPAFSAKFDYFFFTSNPVTPEDGARNILTLSTTGDGSVGASPAGPYACYDSVTVTANPNSGSEFTNWSGDLSGSDNPETLTMDGPKSVTANFNLIENTLTVNVVGNGTVTKDPNQATYNYDDVVTLTAVPDPGWTFARWSGDVTSTDNPLEVIIKKNTSVTATFTTDDEYSLTVNTVGSGSVDVDPQQTTYHYGDVVTLTAVADTDWSFAGWSGDASGSDNPKKITILGNTNVTATFTTVDEYSLTVNTVGNGSVDVDPDQTTYHYGDVVTLTAVADTDWSFAGWSGDESGSDNPMKITILGNTNVTATFTIPKLFLPIILKSDS